MTINIALATYDAIVLGCDSLSSVRTPYLSFGELAKDADGELLVDADGNHAMPFAPDRIVRPVTSVFGGVSKMFCLHADAENECVVAAVTSGQAILNGITIAALAQRFKRARAAATYTSAEAVSRDFLGFVRAAWERDAKYATLTGAARQGLPTVQFLVAGYGPRVAHGQIFRVDVLSNTCEEQFPRDGHCGICWAGTANFAACLIRGVAPTLYDQLATPATRAAWQAEEANISYGNLPTQYAVDLVSLLVNAQSGMMRVSTGIPTVGGRTRIGVLRRGEGFAPLSHSAVKHRNVGYSDGL